MDNEGTAMRQQMDDTMTGLADKLGELGHQVSGTYRTVKDSVNTVRDTFDLKLQVRQRPWTFLAGATALGFLLGSRSNNGGAGHPSRNGRSANNVPLPRVAAADPNNGTNGVEAAPSWLANLGGTFHPEITALRGIVAGAAFELVREMIAKQAPTRPRVRQVGDADNDTRRESRIDAFK